MSKKGFTLIELLAVILILAIIALITTPIVLNILEDAKRDTFKSSVEQLIDIAKMDYNEYGRMDSVTYNYDDNEFVCSRCDEGEDLPLDYTGSLDASGEIILGKGKVTSLEFKSKEFTASYDNGVKVNKNE